MSALAAAITNSITLCAGACLLSDEGGGAGAGAGPSEGRGELCAVRAVLCALRCAVLRHIPCEAHALRCDSHVSCHSLSIAMHMHRGVDDGQAGGPSSEAEQGKGRWEVHGPSSIAWCMQCHNIKPLVPVPLRAASWMPPACVAHMLALQWPAIHPQALAPHIHCHPHSPTPTTQPLHPNGHHPP